MSQFAVYGRPNDCQATLSAYDLTSESSAFAQGINAELAQCHAR